MKISTAVREYAVMQICRDHRLDAAGAELPLYDLAEAWPQTGLREEDLEFALSEMIGAGFFKGLPLNPESPLVVSEIGAEMLERSPLGLFGMDEYLRINVALKKLRGRSHSRPLSGFSRDQGQERRAAGGSRF